VKFPVQLSEMRQTRHRRGLTIRALLLLSVVVSAAARQVPATQPVPAPPPSAQAPAAQPPVSTTPPTKITTGTQEVVVDLVVRDKHGNLVKDLTTADLEIRDAGLPVKINSLRLIAGGQANEPGAKGAARAVRLVSLVFEHYGPDAGQLARETADEILKADTAATLFYSVMQVDRRLRLVQYFSTDKTLLRNAVESACLGARSRYRSDVDAAEKNMTSMNGGDNQRLALGDTTGVSVTDMTMASMMIKALQDSEQTSRDTQSRPTLGALQALAQQLGTLPGRKSVVYFSEGLPLTATGKQQLLATINAANRSNVGIYVIDVTGLSMASRAEAGRQMLAARLRPVLPMLVPPAAAAPPASVFREAAPPFR
jgi:VWFA-related protein